MSPVPDKQPDDERRDRRSTDRPMLPASDAFSPSRTAAEWERAKHEIVAAWRPYRDRLARLDAKRRGDHS